MHPGWALPSSSASRLALALGVGSMWFGPMGARITPRMSLGHALLALGLTGYVLFAMRYEERDLARTFGVLYNRWRGAAR